MLSALESDLVDSLWKSKAPLTSKELFDEWGDKHHVASSTISVTLDRLFEKGLLDRKVERGRGGLKYLYSAKLSREELANELSDKFVHFLKQTFGSASIAHLKKRL